MVNKLQVSISVKNGKAEPDANLAAIRNAVAAALRQQGVTVSTDAVEVTGSLTEPLRVPGARR